MEKSRMWKNKKKLTEIIYQLKHEKSLIKVQPIKVPFEKYNNFITKVLVQKASFYAVLDPPEENKYENTLTIFIQFSDEEVWYIFEENVSLNYFAKYYKML